MCGLQLTKAWTSTASALCLKPWSMFDYVPGSEMARPYGSSLFNFPRDWTGTLSSIADDLLHLHQECSRVYKFIINDEHTKMGKVENCV